MGHHITGLVTRLSAIRAICIFKKLSPPVELQQDFAFLPLTSDMLDFLLENNIGEVVPDFMFLGSALTDYLLRLSNEASVAYIETDYQGGTGTQSAAFFEQGKLTFRASKHGTPQSKSRDSHQWPINRALRMLGVACPSKGTDEFDAIGLDYVRSMDDWLDWRAD